jgi:hypothetical protein
MRKIGERIESLYIYIYGGGQKLAKTNIGLKIEVEA